MIVGLNVSNHFLVVADLEKGRKTVAAAVNSKLTISSQDQVFGTVSEGVVVLHTMCRCLAL